MIYILHLMAFSLFDMYTDLHDDIYVIILVMRRKLQDYILATMLSFVRPLL